MCPVSVYVSCGCVSPVFACVLCLCVSCACVCPVFVCVLCLCPVCVLCLSLICLCLCYVSVFIICLSCVVGPVFLYPVFGRHMFVRTGCVCILWLSASDDFVSPVFLCLV